MSKIRNLTIYDAITVGLIGAALLFFYLAVSELSDSRYLSGIIALAVGIYVFSKSLGILKISAALRASKRNG